MEVRIHGIIAKDIEKLLNFQIGRWPIYPSSCILFIDYSDFDIPIGAKFLYFIERIPDEIIYPIQGELIQITQSFLKPFTAIPKGHKTICEIKLDELPYSCFDLNYPQ